MPTPGFNPCCDSGGTTKLGNYRLLLMWAHISLRVIKLHASMMSICLSVCLSVCRQIPKLDFLKK